MNKSPISNSDNMTVFVGGIPGTVTPMELKAYFSRFGRIAGVHIPVKKENSSLNNGFCYITFASKEAKSDVLKQKDHLIGARRVSCRNYLCGDILATDLSSSNERKLFVKFVPGWLTEEQFRQYFEQFGELESYYMVRFKDASDPKSQKNKSFVGYLVFREQSTCEVLVQKKFLKIGNKKMQVERFDKNHTGKKAEKEPFKSGAEQAIPAADSSNDHSVKPTSKAYFNSRLDYHNDIFASMVSRQFDDSRYQLRIRQQQVTYPKVISDFNRVLPSATQESMSNSEVSIDSETQRRGNFHFRQGKKSISAKLADAWSDNLCTYIC